MPKEEHKCNETGLEVIERLRFLVTLPHAGTSQMEGGGIRVAIPHFKSRPVICDSTI